MSPSSPALSKAALSLDGDSAANDPAALRLAEAGESRALPANYAAEQTLLAGILANNEAITEVEDLLREEHFHIPLFGRLYRTCVELFSNRQIANAVTLARSFAEDPELALLGGTEYLEELQESWVKLSDLRDYAEVIRDSHLRRRIVEISERAMREALHPAPEVRAETQLEALEEQLYLLGETGEAHGRLLNIGDGFAEVIESTEKARKGDPSHRPLASGFQELDKIIGGLYRSDLLVLAGRPSMGKSALATNMALKVTQGKGVVAFFSLEMSHQQLAARLLSELSGVTATDMRRGNVSEVQFRNIYEANRTLEGISLYVDDSAMLTVGAIRARARRLKRINKRLDLIVVDYLQLIQPGRATDNRVLEIGEITRGLKSIAKELNVPVVALSQLSRALEQREDKRPHLSDLRESGSIEQDADIVMFIYREIYYLEKREPKAGDERFRGDTQKYEAAFQDWKRLCDEAHGRADLIVAKHRHGPTGIARLFFDQKATRFTDLEEEGVAANDGDMGADDPYEGGF